MAKEKPESIIHYAEDDDTEKLRIWWKKNGTAIIVGLVLGIGSVAGYQGWNLYSANRNELASDIYQSMLRDLEVGKLAEVSVSARQLVSDYKGTAYADTALLMLAKISVENENYQEAIDYLSTVVEVSKDSAFRQVARLRWATLELSNGNLKSAEQLLSDQEPGSFGARYDELLGDIYAAKGEIEKAKQAYQDAIESSGSVTASQILSRKLNLIGGASE
ncbi:MAG: hypothetical protein CL398_07160 [Acidiferrobacteraceae bacterium]|nr:hypothetical protein [Acidiferrobacteraceae bacterium]